MLPALCGLRESEGCVLRQQIMAQSPDRNAAREPGRRRKWAATTSKLNDNTCETLSPQNFTTPAQIKVLVAQQRQMRLLF
jgi:hypothetical protein